MHTYLSIFQSMRPAKLVVVIDRTYILVKGKSLEEGHIIMNKICIQNFLPFNKLD